MNRVVELIERHRMFAPGDRVGVAVSGGPDSVCLLYLLRELGVRWSLELSVVHVDHQLRGEASRADAGFVENLAGGLKLPFHLERAHVEAGEGGLEQAARQARLDFFHRLLAAGTVSKIATGHTRSDQAETVLLRLLRGAGGTGLAGVLPVTAQGLVRPLLATSRREVEAWLTERGIPWRTDETNLSREFLRNRIRLDLLPELEQRYNPRIETILAQTADLAAEEERFWDQAVPHAAARLFVPGTPEHVAILPAGELAREERAMARRLVRRAIARVRGSLRQIEFEHVEAALKLCETREGHGRVILPGVDVMRSFDWIRFSPPGMDHLQSRVQVVPLAVPGDTWLPGRRRGVRTRLAVESGYNKGQVESEQWARLDWETVEKPLELRFWLPGDQYQAVGRQHPEKLKQMFQESRIPLWERRFWPIIESRRGIVWTRFGSSARHTETSATRQVLEIREIE